MKKVFFPLFSEFMEVKMEVNDQIFFVFYVDDHNLMLLAKFQPSISIFRAKRSLYKSWCQIVSNCHPPLQLLSNSFKVVISLKKRLYGLNPY